MSNKVAQVGKWYYLRYHGDTFLGECMAVTERGLVLRFADNGEIFRSAHFIPLNDVHDEGQDPRWSTSIKNVIKEAWGD